MEESGVVDVTDEMGAEQEVVGVAIGIGVGEDMRSDDNHTNEIR